MSETDNVELASDNIVQQPQLQESEAVPTNTPNSDASNEVSSLRKQVTDLRRIISNKGVQKFLADDTEENRVLRLKLEEKISPEARLKLLDFCRENSFSQTAADALIKRELRLIEADDARAEEENRLSKEQEETFRRQQEEAQKVRDEYANSNEYKEATGFLDKNVDIDNAGLTQDEKGYIDAIYQHPFAKSALGKLFANAVNSQYTKKDVEMDKQQIPGTTAGVVLSGDEEVNETNYDKANPAKQYEYASLNVYRSVANGDKWSDNYLTNLERMRKSQNKR